ncbi:MAG: hypothetical protein U9Q70_09260, partial [Chloroflexota bacterium]|nr:hypothetical protein [Chloroflexota bacterium]
MLLVSTSPHIYSRRKVKSNRLPNSGELLQSKFLYLHLYSPNRNKPEPKEKLTTENAEHAETNEEEN